MRALTRKPASLFVTRRFLMNKDLFLEEYHTIISPLQYYHEIFYKIAAVGEPYLTDAIPTAAVGFDKQGGFLKYYFNPDFIEKLNPYQLRFVVCHEMLHILCNHGKRTVDIDDYLRPCANIAMDIVVNHNLLDSFRFMRSLLGPLGNELAFFDTVFGRRPEFFEAGETFEFYFNKLKKDPPQDDGKGIFALGNGGTLDDHSQLPSLTREELEKVLEEALGEDQAGKLMESLDRRGGHAPAMEDFEAIFKYVPKKQKWEDIFAGYDRKIRGIQERDKETWAATSRRMALMSSNVLLPSMMEMDDEDGYKYDLWVFQDVSGSCVGHLQRFLDAARSIPTDMARIKFHAFDTDVRRIDIKSRDIRAGGGTYFHIIEEYIEERVQAGEKYPNIIVIISDGDGNEVQPRKPHLWNWVLVTDHCHFIPEESKVYSLQDFE